jgi:hypothetical protein
MIGSRVLSAALSLFAMAWVAGCIGGKKDDGVVGSWIQVFPGQGALEATTFLADGTIAGSVVGLETPIGPSTHWRIGHPLMPDGFCVGDSRHWSCQAYALIGDTLWIANRTRTAYLRGGRGRAGPQRPWDGPLRYVAAPPPPGSKPPPDTSGHR